MVVLKLQLKMKDQEKSSTSLFLILSNQLVERVTI